MYIEVKIGNFAGDIGELASTYSPDFVQANSGFPGVKKYELFKREETGIYTLTIRNSPSPNLRYNVIVDVIGSVEARISEIMSEFEGKIPFELRPVSEEIRQERDEVNDSFEYAFHSGNILEKKLSDGAWVGIKDNDSDSVEDKVLFDEVGVRPRNKYSILFLNRESSGIAAYHLDDFELAFKYYQGINNSADWIPFLKNT